MFVVLISISIRDTFSNPQATILLHLALLSSSGRTSLNLFPFSCTTRGKDTAISKARVVSNNGAQLRHHGFMFRYHEPLISLPITTVHGERSFDAMAFKEYTASHSRIVDSTSMP